jgi:hypothetical protein
MILGIPHNQSGLCSSTVKNQIDWRAEGRMLQC